MNGNGELTETENVIFLRKLRSSYGILTYFSAETYKATDTCRWKQGIIDVHFSTVGLNGK